MGVQGHPKAERAYRLQLRLRLECLLRDLEGATESGRPYVELIGIKAGNNELEEFEREHVPEFKTYLNDRSDIQEILKPYRNMGFAFIWTGYFDPTGTEVSFSIERNAAAEARLRLLVEGLHEDNSPDERQISLF